MRRTRLNHRPTFKAQVACAAVKGEQTLAESAEHFITCRFVIVPGCSGTYLLPHHIRALGAWLSSGRLRRSRPRLESAPIWHPNSNKS